MALGGASMHEAARRPSSSLCLRLLIVLAASCPSTGIFHRAQKAPDQTLDSSAKSTVDTPLRLQRAASNSSTIGPERRTPRSQAAVPFIGLEVHRIAWSEAAKLEQLALGASPGGEAGRPSGAAGKARQLDVDSDDSRKRRIYQRDREPVAKRSLPRPRVTLFKALFGVAFAVCLVVTCAFRQFDDTESAETKKNPDVSSASGGPGAGGGIGSAPSQPSETVKLVKASVIVILWMIFSVVFIIFNKYMFSKGGFPYPVTLTAMHMGSCYVVFGFARFLPVHLRHALMPDVDKHIPLGLYLKGLVPAALLMAVCLGIGNLGFLYATVAFIQMVKPVNIVVTSLAGFAWGLEVATPTHVFIAILVSGGVAIAAAGEVQFSLMGLICQLCASTGEGLRLIILQGIMQGSLKLDPISTLYRFTPVAGFALCVLSCLIEGPVIWAGLKLPGVLVLNCLMAVCLNVLIAAVVQQTSAVVFVLAGVFKDIATIVISAVLYQTPITGQEVGGYAISMIGICLFKVYKDNLQAFKERGMFGASSDIIGNKAAYLWDLISNGGAKKATS